MLRNLTERLEREKAAWKDDKAFIVNEKRRVMEDRAGITDRLKKIDQGESPNRLCLTFYLAENKGVRINKKNIFPFIPGKRSQSFTEPNQLWNSKFAFGFVSKRNSGEGHFLR